MTVPLSRLNAHNKDILTKKHKIESKHCLLKDFKR